MTATSHKHVSNWEIFSTIFFKALPAVAITTLLFTQARERIGWVAALPPIVFNTLLAVGLIALVKWLAGDMLQRLAAESQRHRT